MGHVTLIRAEYRFPWLAAIFKTTIGEEYRIICSCGWTEKAWGETEAQARAWKHEKYPHK